MTLRPLVLALVLVVAPAAASADELPSVTTEHQLALDDQELSYRAVAEFLQLEDARGRPTGRVFTVSYLVDGEAGRPVTFAFNGGPGAASAYLHIGALGPHALAVSEDGEPLRSAHVVPNPDTWLAYSDLVLVDPIGTGFSRPDPGLENPERRFYGVSADLEALVEVIRLWLDRHNRWGAPIMLAGESYGGLRAAALTRRLPRDAGIEVAAAVLISPVLDFQTIRADSLNPLPWIGLLPSLVATAREHGLIEGHVPTPAEVEAFALSDYAKALLEPERLDAILPTLARWTGLSEELLRARRGRIGASEYRRTVLQERDRLLSAYDGALSAPDPDPVRPFARFEPGLEGLSGPFTTAMVAHLRADLGWQEPGEYVLLSREVNRQWRWRGERGQGWVSAVEALQEGLVLNPDLRVLIVHGETDLVTPYFASEWLARQIRANVPDAADRLLTRVLAGGHMMYLRPDSRAALTGAVASLLAAGS